VYTTLFDVTPLQSSWYLLRHDCASVPHGTWLGGSMYPYQPDRRSARTMYPYRPDRGSRIEDRPDRCTYVSQIGVRPDRCTHLRSDRPVPDQCAHRRSELHRTSPSIWQTVANHSLRHFPRSVQRQSVSASPHNEQNGVPGNKFNQHDIAMAARQILR
jgi:hypothetical protein